MAINVGDLTGRVAFVTGAAQGQGRSHARRLAEAGADIVAIDICEQLPMVPYGMGDEAGLAETVRLVEEVDRRVHAVKVDVRDRSGLADAVREGVEALGRLDIVVANASVCTVQPHEEVTESIWNDTLDIDLTGVWNTCSVALPHLHASGGGSIVVTGSTGSVIGLPFYLPYVVAKHALVGLVRSLALELADRNVRVNMIIPTGVDTAQGHSEILPALLAGRPDLGSLFQNTLPVDRIQPEDISAALLFLASDAARYITGVTLPVDAGRTIR